MRLRSAATAVLALTVSLSTVACHSESIEHGPIPPPTVDLPLANRSGRATVVFAGGCFWGTQAVFERVKGVLATTAGYPAAPLAPPTTKTSPPKPPTTQRSVEVVYDLLTPHLRPAPPMSSSPSTTPPPSTARALTPAPPTAPPSSTRTTIRKRVADAYIAQLDAAHAWKHRSSRRSSRSKPSTAPRTTTRTTLSRIPTTPTSWSATVPRSPHSRPTTRTSMSRITATKARRHLAITTGRSM